VRVVNDINPVFSFDDEEDEDDKEEVAANEAVFGSGGGWPFLSRVRAKKIVFSKFDPHFHEKISGEMCMKNVNYNISHA